MINAAESGLRSRQMATGVSDVSSQAYEYTVSTVVVANCLQMAALTIASHTNNFTSLFKQIPYRVQMCHHHSS